MKFMNQKTGWFAGASMLALGLSAVPAAAQDADSEASVQIVAYRRLR